jgi:signal transduction histidine kinase
MLGFRLAALIALAIAFVTSFGWFFDVVVLIDWRGRAAHSGPANLAGLLLSASLCIAHWRSGPRGERWSLGLAWVSLVATLATLAMALLQVPRELMVEPLAFAALSAISTAVIISDDHPFFSQSISLAIALFACIGLFSYFYNVSVFLWQAPFNGLSGPTSALLAMQSISAIGLLPRRGLLRAWTSSGPTQRFAQTVVPTMLVAILLGPWLGRLGVRAGLYEAELQGVAESTIALVLIVGIAAFAMRQLQVSEDAALRQSRRFEAAARASQALIYEWKPRQDEVLRIRGVKELVGYEDAELGPTSASWRALIHPNDLAGLHAPTGTSPGQYLRNEYRLRHKQGHYISVLDSMLVVETGAGGEILLAIGSTIDISEARIRQRELQDKNELLEQFTHVAAHDLQEPLRMMAVFTQLLEESLRGRTNTEQTDWMRRIVNSATRMSVLLTDLRAFLEVSRPQFNLRAPVAIADSLERALDNLQLSIRESGARIDAGPLPSVYCPAPLLVLVFQNLISNAIKYAGDAPPRIRIRAVETESEWRIDIEDWGIGIDTANQSVIFAPFQRLSSDNQGSGLGLAICQSILRRCQGRIWVESGLNEGATFRLAFPKEPGFTPQESL